MVFVAGVAAATVVPSADANAPEELGGWFRPIVERLAMDVAALCEEGGA